MGQVIRKAIRNILEAPLDVLIQLAGKGLEKVVEDDVPQIAVKCGSGLELGDDLAVRVKTGHGCGHYNDQVVIITGPGLVINDQDQVAVNPGDGVEVKNDQVAVKVADGLGFNDAKQVVVVPGDNIAIKDGKVTLDNEPLECNCGVISFLVNSELTIKGKKLILKKTFQDYTATRNKAGFLLDIVLVNTRHEEDTVELPADSGYVAMMSVPNRETTAKSPNFYKK